MTDHDLSHLLRFADVASNPYIVALQQAMSALLPEAAWWIANERMRRLPFPAEGAAPRRRNGEDDGAPADLKADPLLKKAANQAVVTRASKGVLEGFVGFRLRGRLLGGLGVSNLSTRQRPVLTKILIMIEGYFALLAGALEDHDDLELVHSILAETITLVELDHLLQRQTDTLCRSLGVTRSVILLVDEDGDFFPAHVKNYPAGLIRRRDLKISRYDYSLPHSADSPGLCALPEDDPLRRWIITALNELHHPVAAGAPCWSIPFIRNASVIGLFITCDEMLESMSLVKQNLIRLLAVGGAAALDYALTLERMKKRHKALSTIHLVHRLISSTFTTSEILPKIGQLTLQLLQAKKCAILLCDDERETLIPKVALGLDQDEAGARPTRVGEGLAGWVAENFNPVLFHPEVDSRPWGENGETYPSESYLAVALFDTDIEGVIMVTGKRGDFTPGDREILVTFAEQAVLAIQNARIHEGERVFTIKALKSIANLIETQDPARAGVTEIACRWAERISRRLQMGESEAQYVVYAALLHETGMLRTFNSENGSYEEQRRKGPRLSLRVVESLGLSDDVGRIVYHVNELWNGEGYPDQLKGREIPLGSRVVAVANAFSTLLNRSGNVADESPATLGHAFRVLARLANKSYDPDVVEALREAIDELTKEES
ncbi:MAG: GAF domain-containing protein [bacterium]|nr:GAF domain-containing protein [bacterium]